MPHRIAPRTNYAAVVVAFVGVHLACGAQPRQPARAPQPDGSTPVLKQEFIYEDAPFPSCHASTIAETKDGLVAAWFGGTDEGEKDVGIWFSRHAGGEGDKWSAPVEVATGVTGEVRHPCWNPVLFVPDLSGPKSPGVDNPLMLFYKVGPNPREWWGMFMISKDGGQTWEKPERLPDGILGPIKNKPVQLPAAGPGFILSGSSTEDPEDDEWRVHMETLSRFGRKWDKTPPINPQPAKIGAIQPAILTHPNNVYQILCRSRQGKVAESWSRDGGKTWEPMRLGDLPNPDSGLDAVTLKDGRHLLVYNHTRLGRSPLNVAVSNDGKSWKMAAVLVKELGEYSYPAIIQTRDGKVHVTYTWKRQRIRHAVLNPAKFQPTDLPQLTPTP